MATQSTQMNPRHARSPRLTPRPTPRLEQRPVARVRSPRPVVERPVDPRRLAVYRRRRAIAVAFVLLVVGTILVLAFIGGRVSADGSSPGEVRPAAVYVVRPGDTLWDLAVAIAPDRDPRVVVAALERSAGGAAVHPGQRIVLPASLQR